MLTRSVPNFVINLHILVIRIIIGPRRNFLVIEHNNYTDNNTTQVTARSVINCAIIQLCFIQISNKSHAYNNNIPR